MPSEAVSFAVVIAVYNGAETIARAVDSVLGQSYPPAELIVVNDGSADRTLDALAPYASRITIIDQPNAGVSAARNRGVQAASSEWIAFLDADDYYYPDRLKWHADWIAEDPNLDFLTGDFDYVTSNGDFIRRSMESNPVGRALLQRRQDALRSLMTESDFEGFIAEHFGDTHTLSVRRKTFLELGGYPTNFAVCEDVNLLVRLVARSSKVGVVGTPLAAYVIHSESATRAQPIRAQQQTVAALESLWPALQSATPNVRRGLRTAIQSARFDLAAALLRAGERWAAIRATVPLIVSHPSWPSIRTFLSVVRG